MLSHLGFGGTTLGATAGDVGIAIEPLTEVADITRLRRGDMVFAWDGKTHLITDYIPRSGYAIPKFTDYMDPLVPSGYITPNDTYALGLQPWGSTKWYTNKYNTLWYASRTSR